MLISTLSFAVFALKPVRVAGLLKNTNYLPVKLYAVVDGRNLEIATAKPTKTGNFGFQFYPEYEGLYCIGTGNGVSPDRINKFYFKPGDELNVEINDSTYVLTGKTNSKENVILTQWYNQCYQVEKNSLKTFRQTFVTFFPQLEALNKQSKTFLNGKNSGNQRFDKKIKQIVTTDMAFYAGNFLNTPRSAHPSPEEYSPMYANLKVKDFAVNTQTLYTYPFGIRLLESLISLEMRINGIKRKQGLDGLEQTMSLVPNDTLKGELVLINAAYMKNFDAYSALMASAGKYILTLNQKAKDHGFIAPLATLKRGDTGLDFSYADNKGKTVKMSDLKGKVVVIDVWATWCGPCKAEIPSLKKLEEEMKGKDVQIVSISVDDLKDKAKWEKMIVDEKLGGLQLFAGGSGNDLSKYYKVNTIPRFLLFDKEGKIISVDAPRPSEPALKTLIEAELGK